MNMSNNVNFVQIELEQFLDMQRELDAYRKSVTVCKESWNESMSVEVDLHAFRGQIDAQLENLHADRTHKPVDWKRPMVATLYSVNEAMPKEEPAETAEEKAE